MIRDLYLDQDPIVADIPAPRYRHGMRAEHMECHEIRLDYTDDNGRCLDAIVAVVNGTVAWVTAYDEDGHEVNLRDEQQEAIVAIAGRV